MPCIRFCPRADLIAREPQGRGGTWAPSLPRDSIPDSAAMAILPRNTLKPASRDAESSWKEFPSETSLATRPRPAEKRQAVEAARRAFSVVSPRSCI